MACFATLSPPTFKLSAWLLPMCLSNTATGQPSKVSPSGALGRAYRLSLGLIHVVSGHSKEKNLSSPSKPPISILLTILLLAIVTYLREAGSSLAKITVGEEYDEEQDEVCIRSKKRSPKNDAQVLLKGPVVKARSPDGAF